jgi:hypothetical protein
VVAKAGRIIGEPLTSAKMNQPSSSIPNRDSRPNTQETGFKRLLCNSDNQKVSTNEVSPNYPDMITEIEVDMWWWISDVIIL